MRHTNPLRLHLYALFLLLVCVAVSPAASAQWWRFGTDASEPVFTDLLFNQVSALRVERLLQFTPQDLQNGKVMVRGRAEIGSGAIGRVEASLDDGVSWMEVPFNDRGLFAFEFTPQPERGYRFRIRALSTTGKASDDTAHAFEFKLVREDTRALALAAFEQLLERYMAEDRAGFMAQVSADFVGNLSALDNALGDDFRFFDAIRIRPTVQRVAAADTRYTINFSFTRQVRSTRSGQLLQDQAVSSLTLIREGEGYKLYELAAPLIFGVSDTEDVATYVADGAAGTPVITVDDNGNVSTLPVGQQVEPEDDAGIPLSLAQLTVPGHPPAYFDFATGIQSDTGGDFSATGGDSSNGIWTLLEPGVSIVDLGPVGIEDLRTAPASGYSSASPLYLRPGYSYAFRLASGRYALLRITHIAEVSNLPNPPYPVADIEYKYQPDGSRNF